MIQRAVDGSSTEILEVANLPVLWICALGVFAVIIVQSVIYIRAARVAAPAGGMSRKELNTSFRAGAVSAIGPSLAVALVAIALLAVFGAPAVLVRIGLIGSVSFETGAASIAAGTMDAELGGPTYTQGVFAVAFMAMSLGGSMWMIATLIMTPLLKRGDVSLRKVNPAIMTVVPGAALLAAFFALGLGELPKSGNHVVAFLTSALAMAACLGVAHVLKRQWMKEWSLGIAILIALIVTYLVVQSGAFPVPA
ncbi:DUF5058 family protein [Kocuria sp. JC486]|uniref:DUF5058 family protein n=1 Tax=Kocuria soli TaxID=2485125 RepID=A0A3N3ZQA5_9MICC|nr:MULTISPECIES: DUF5058 family protein [Kocuria]NHU84978.1 DUF5058 family protein [Kocuria sp. JC486]ROZ63303.1 DUF5058 family protein [Kocuria soli]